MEDALAEMSHRVVAAGIPADEDELSRRLLEREKLGCTGLGSGVAIPHCKLAGLSEVVLAVGVSKDGVDFCAPDSQPVHVIFLILSPPQAAAQHLQALARVSRLLRSPETSARLAAADTPARLEEALRVSEAALAPASP
jgi:PTS system nitrogen regulatory IIA component